MKKELFRKVDLSEGVSADIEGQRIKITGPEGENSRKFSFAGLEVKKEDNGITIGSKKATKNEKKMMNTIAAHIKNMVEGVQKKFEYELKAVFSHFPMTLEVKGNELVIKNFLGEKVARRAKIL